MPQSSVLWEVVRSSLAMQRSTPPIRQVPRDGELPHSFAQQRLWFLQELHPASFAYNMPTIYRLRGRLDTAALAQSLSEVVRRHEVLRTSLATVDGRPCQVIAPAQALWLPVVDCREFPEAEREARARQEARDILRRPFDLSRGPVFRCLLLRMAEDEHWLVLVVHHIAADLWSVGILVQELGTLYEAFTDGKPPALPPLAIQYADYAVWQRQWLQGEVREAQRAYWKKQLGGRLPVSELPTDRPRPPTQTCRGGVQTFVLAERLIAAITALGQQEEATLFMTLLAAFKTLLYRYSGRTDIAVGTAIANRNRPETRKVIGFLANTLVMRTDLSGNPTFRQLLRRVRDVALGAYAHQDLPFEMLVEELQPVRDMSRSPLFQIMFVAQNISSKALDLQLPGLSVSAIPRVGELIGRSMFDLTVSMTQQEPDPPKMLFEYNSDLFDDTTIARMMGHFETLLHGIVADPDRRLSDVPMLSEEELDQVVVTWNDTQADYPQSRCIHQLFETQAELTPDVTAAVLEHEHLTYRELNRRANQLAHALRAMGVGPGVRAGIFLERSLEMLVALLSVLKAGGAYVPLDASHPPARLAFVLADAEIPVILTQQRLAGRLPATNARAICLDSDWPALATESRENPGGGATAADPAYVIYTSGSTGQPKGVVIQHRALVNYIWWAKEVYLQGERLDFPLYSSPAFDLTVTSIYTPLVSGNRVVICRPEGGVPPLAELLERGQVGVVKLTPSHLSLIVGRDNRRGCVRRLIVGGEALETRLARQALESLGGRVEIYNEYGPTEATVGCMVHRFDPAADTRAFVPIGRPAANTRIYVLDGELHVVPENVIGELCISGDGLAAGYLNRGDLTSLKFVDDPFFPGQKMYRTGDLARRLPSGALEFVGRTDDQVKIRGFRVELGEVEAALSEHPAVREVAVLAREDGLGDRRLVAYLALERGQTLTTSDVRRYLQERLPEPVVPSAFVMLEELPLGPGGKVDRHALLAPDGARPELERPFVAPRTPVEQQLAALWTEMLRLDRVGVHDSFFELGGHSLLATQLVSRVRDSFGVELLLREIFELPTIAGIAEQVETMRWAAGGLSPAREGAEGDREEGEL